jgi:hypothetical protein
MARLESLQRIHRHTDLSVSFTPATNTLLNGLEYIGCVISRATLSAHTRRDVLNLHVPALDFAMESDSSLNDWPATILTSFIFPKTHVCSASLPSGVVLVDG